jgi:hypothetical protein
MHSITANSEYSTRSISHVVLCYIVSSPLHHQHHDNYNRRDLQIADWSVTIESVSDQTLSFSTGAGGGSNPNTQVRVYDLCRSESATRTDVGSFYPTSTVSGIIADRARSTNIFNHPNDPDDGLSTISFKVVQGIAENTDIYTANNEDNTATIEFCAEVGLYDNAQLISFAEIKLAFTVDLVASISIPAMSDQDAGGKAMTSMEALADQEDDLFAPTSSGTGASRAASYIGVILVVSFHLLL